MFPFLGIQEEQSQKTLQPNVEHSRLVGQISANVYSDLLRALNQTVEQTSVPSQVQAQPLPSSGWCSLLGMLSVQMWFRFGAGKAFAVLCEYFTQASIHYFSLFCLLFLQTKRKKVFVYDL